MSVKDSTTTALVVANSTTPIAEAVKVRDARITAIVLTIIAFLLLAVSFILFGIGSMDPTQNLGLGAFAYLGGTFLSFTALGIIVGAIGFGGYAFSENQKKGEKGFLSWMDKFC